ncbi:protein YIPF3-like [Photinus pyralis]|uniref:protein YIPF3-like n=1 Tax=Photinus pyralis TaxID=7054 RepID=UPI001266FEAA|nr:protein YIPF3-like [Photinus pyralis]
MFSRLKTLVWITPQEFCWRVLVSFLPPVSVRFNKVYVDFVGPCFAIVMLTLVLNYGNLQHKFVHLLAPIQSVFLYVLVAPVICYILNGLGRSKLTFLELFCIVTYALYGHIVTLVISFVFYLEESNLFFFSCMVVFAGLSALRLVFLQMQSIPLPGARLIVCSFSSIVHVLFLIFLHFTYMHPSFKYGRKARS